jgi:transposase-like protein
VRCEAVKHRSRLEQAERLGVAAGALAVGQPLRQVAAGLGVAPSTLRGWRATVPGNEMLAGVLAAVSTPAGARWLHRLVVRCLW